MKSQKLFSPHRGFSIATMIALVFGAFLLPMGASAAEVAYQLYPTPQQISYGDGSFTLGAKANVVVEDGIDAETKARLDEVLKLKNITKEASNAATEEVGKTQILVGINGSDKAVDKYVKTLKTTAGLRLADDLFTGKNHNDAYLLAAVPGDSARANTIVVLGKDTDSAFYGLTTLYRIFQQMSGSDIRVLTIQDYADVITRGFIEGYYGEPWSTEDRVELMRWGGYQKLNAYVYAPKDDPKHNAKWRELYTEEELKSKIAPLAKAGNDSKVRFVYALHPYMHTPITSGNYNESTAIMKKKFTQVMDHGVRQIAILADDAHNQGPAHYAKMLEDMTAWLKEKQAEKKTDGTPKYPGLKTTLIFCPVAYYGNGESWYKTLPENVQVVNTGGRVWGKVDNNFVTRFQRNSGNRSPFMWINWPCSDNDKDALHMGGHNSFLGADVKPGSVEGVVLNPMQQSEPSKHAIFMNADFTWNLWKSANHADKAWEDSFSYVDHNSPAATAASKALRNLSEHMRRIFGGGVVFENAESASVKDKVVSFQTKAAAGTATAEETDAIAEIFAGLAQDAKTYRANPGTPRTFTQIEPWIGAWGDLTSAADHFLKSYKASLTDDAKTMVAEYNAAKAAMDAYGKHKFSYVDHMEYAKVGKMYLMPMVDVLANKLAEKVVLAAGPEADMTAYITSRSDAPDGGTPVTAAYDGSEATKLIYKSPNKITKDTYFGLLKSKPFDLTSVKFVQGAPNGKDFIEHAKIQVFDGKAWIDVEGQDNLTGSKVEAYDLTVKNVHGVRLIATANNSRDAWPTIAEIAINPKKPVPAVPGTISSVGTAVYGNNVAANAQDGDESTLYWIHNSGGDYVNANNPVVLTFNQPTEIDTVLFVQGPKDKISSGVLEYSADGSDNWNKLADVTGDAKQEFKFKAVTAKAVRIKPAAQYPIWWQIGEFRAYAAADAPTPEPGADNPEPKPSFTVTAVAAVPAHGKVSVSPAGAQPTGTEVTLTAKANAGFEFVNWADASGKAVSQDAVFKVTVGNADAKYTAVFKQIETPNPGEVPGEEPQSAEYSLAVNGTGASASVSVGEKMHLIAKPFPAGTEVTFTLHSDPILLGTVRAADDGAAVLDTVMPNVSAGKHTIVASAVVAGKKIELRQEVQVTAKSDQTQPSQPALDQSKADSDKNTGSGLAKTGAGVLGLLVMAGFLGATGISLISRRRDI
ncbi:beta-N-acetylglucosaminidase domain-containing protein [Arcanobacterium hippocoleae]